MEWIKSISEILRDLGVFAIPLIVGYLAQLARSTLSNALQLSDRKVIQDAEILRRFELLFEDLKDLRSDIATWKELHQKETAAMEAILNERIGKVEQAQALEPELSPRGEQGYQMKTEEFRALRDAEYKRNIR